MAGKKVIFSFFSGSGFLDLGFETNGFDIDLVNEYSPEFIRAYKYSREKMGLRKPRFGYFNIDINEFLEGRKEELQEYINTVHAEGDVVGFIGGPPCPDFSIAGKNRGRNGDNGKLSKSYVDLIMAMQPDFFLFENVKGLWKTARHREFYEELKSAIVSVGYALTDRLTNALEFGAPQDRDRILLFGIKRNLLVTPERIAEFPWNAFRKWNADEIKSLPWPVSEPFVADSVSTCPEGLPEAFTVEYWFRKNDVAHHANASDFFTPHNGLSRMETVDEGDVSKKSYKRLHRWRYSPTVAYGNNEVHLHPYKPRRLSAAEALALQTLPKEFELPEDMTLTNKFKTIGNGVPYLLSSGIAKTIAEFLESENLIGGASL
jgi:DNA (cytosine-5)-methyltransferase 1